MSQLKRRLDAIENNPTLQQDAKRRRYQELLDTLPKVYKHPQNNTLPVNQQVFLYVSYPDDMAVSDECRDACLPESQAAEYTRQFKAAGARYVLVTTADVEKAFDEIPDDVTEEELALSVHGVRYVE